VNGFGAIAAGAVISQDRYRLKVPDGLAFAGISEVTLQIHRANVMRKMKARSLAALVRMAVALERR
jgi:FixJ family two-component response regulator